MKMGKMTVDIDFQLMTVFSALGYCMAIAIFVRGKNVRRARGYAYKEYLKAYEEARGEKLTEKCGWKSMHCHTWLHWQEYNWCRWNQGNQEWYSKHEFLLEGGLQVGTDVRNVYKLYYTHTQRSILTHFHH